MVKSDTQILKEYEYATENAQMKLSHSLRLIKINYDCSIKIANSTAEPWKQYKIDKANIELEASNKSCNCLYEQMIETAIRNRNIQMEIYQARKKRKELQESLKTESKKKHIIQ
jgi:hypothetical protein